LPPGGVDRKAISNGLKVIKKPKKITKAPRIAL